MDRTNNRKPKLSGALCVATAALMTVATLQTRVAAASGLLIADGGFGGLLEIKEHNVHVTINNGIAVTEIEQVFFNTENRQVEALYTFPVPKGASVANFSMWINGVEMIGEVVEKERARRIYESYKRTRRDPGLLEQVDYKTFEMRIFPIGPRAEQRVRVTYYQQLDFDHEWATYVYPLATVTRRDIDQRTTGKFALTLEVKSEIPIVEMESPSHGDEFVFVEHSPVHRRASLEVNAGDLSRDVVLAFRSSRPRTGIDVITHNAGDEDGYFCLTLTAGDELAEFDKGMDYVFVLDISGSMNKQDKLVISRRQLGAFIDALGPKDRFEIITFNIQATTLFDQLRAVDEQSQQQAAEFLASQRARGGTTLHPAITAAYRYHDPQRALNVVVLSDGMTEQKERGALLDLIAVRPENTRVFCIGVGNEVNRPLLSQLAEDAGGIASFLSRGDNFERRAQAFKRKLTRPVASNLRIEFDGGRVYDLEPPVLPNLYHGSPVRLYGRYRDGGQVRVSVVASVAGKPFRKQLDLDLPDNNPANPEIDRMWAWQKVQRLLKQADRNDSRDKVTDEIVRLGEGYSIATEYTSFIVLENDAEFRRWKIDRRNALRIQRDRAARDTLQTRLTALRRASQNGLGPVQPAKRSTPERLAQAIPDAGSPAVSNSTPPTNARRGSRDLDFGFGFGNGGGAFDPMTGGIVIALGAAGFLSRRWNRNSQRIAE